jgi:hypothetical protein
VSGISSWPQRRPVGVEGQAGVAGERLPDPVPGLAGAPSTWPVSLSLLLMMGLGWKVYRPPPKPRGATVPGVDVGPVDDGSVRLPRWAS